MPKTHSSWKIQILQARMVVQGFKQINNLVVFIGLDKTVKIHRTYHNMIYMFDREDIIERAVQKYKNVKYMSTLQLEYPGIKNLIHFALL